MGPYFGAFSGSAKPAVRPAVHRITIERKVTSYRLITHGFAADFEASINHLLKEGYELYGSPFSHQGDYLKTYAQAMVKYE